MADPANEMWKGYPPVVAVKPGNPEALKYGKMWDLPAEYNYRKVAPGEDLVDMFLDQASPKPGSDVIDFGCGTGRGGAALAAKGKMRVTLVDFVGNCLDPQVRELIEKQPDQIRFVKHDLEQPFAMAAEYGYCTDVMEHIPEARVPTVLRNVLMAAQHVFFSISCQEDNCGPQGIGEELHLTVQPYGWWLEQFARLQCVVHWSQDLGGRACLFYVSAWREAQEVVDIGVVNVTMEKICENVRANCAAGWELVRPHEAQPDAEVVLLGGGPSLNEHLQEVMALRAAGAKLVTMNGSYNWALAHGLVPSATVVVDARPHNARFVRPVVDGCKYLVASQCDPSVLEGLPRDRTLLWHSSFDPRIVEILDEVYGKVWVGVPGGSTVLLRAIPLLRGLGYTKFHLFGCDSCVRKPDLSAMSSTGSLASQHVTGGIHHAYEQRENDGPVYPVNCGGRTFWGQTWMIAQAREFISLIQQIGEVVDLAVYGDGLLAHILNYAADLDEADEGLALAQGQIHGLDEVVPGLYVGGYAGVARAKETGLTVVGVRQLRHPGDDQWVPILVGNHRKNLDAAAEIIESNMPGVYVHCLVGMERAPLTVAWYLHTRRGMTLDAAYALVKAKRPVTEDRREWIEGEDLQGPGSVDAEGVVQ